MVTFLMTGLTSPLLSPIRSKDIEPLTAHSSSTDIMEGSDLIKFLFNPALCFIFDVQRIEIDIYIY